MKGQYEVYLDRWNSKGTFTYKGLTYTKGINDNSGGKVLHGIKGAASQKPFTCTLGELAFYFDSLLLEDIFKSIGFTIGKGKQLHWYISPSPNTGKYRCYPQYDNGEIGHPSYHYPEKSVTIHYVNIQQ